MTVIDQPRLFELVDPDLGEQLTIDAYEPELVIVIPCSGEKKAGIFGDDGEVMTAGERYTGTFHLYARRHAERLRARILILSAAYGLVPLDRMIPDYEKRIEEKDSIASTPGKLAHQAHCYGLDFATVVSFCPAAYTAALAGAVPHLVTPLAGSRGIGDQRHRISVLTREEILS